jgi:hypothetical protein
LHTNTHTWFKLEVNNYFHLLTVITLYLRALRLHDYGITVDHASTRVKLQYTSMSCWCTNSNPSPYSQNTLLPQLITSTSRYIKLKTMPSCSLVRRYYHSPNTGNTKSQDITASCLEHQVIMRSLEWNSNMQARLTGEQ